MATGSSFSGSLSLSSDQVEDNQITTGNSFSGSVSLSSDQVFDRNCTVCEEDNTMSEAVCYCTECCKYYCAKCQGFHHKLHRNHSDKMLDKDAMLKNVPKHHARAILTTMCEEHDKLVEMYCGDHNVVCCTVCVALRHKTCEHTDYIPRIVDGYSKDPAVAKVKADLQAIRSDMISVKSSRHDDQTRIKKEREHVMTEVKHSRRKMNEVFDRLEEAVVRGADTRYDEFSDNIQADIEKCEKGLSEIEKTIQELEKTDISNEAQLFVHVKQGVEKIDAWCELGNRIKQHVGGEKIKFIPNEDVERFMENLKKLGEFVDELKRRISEPRQVDRKENVTVKMEKDGYLCRIFGMCSLPDGGALLSDYRNNKLKRINSSNELVDSCTIVGAGGVCYIEQSEEAAVYAYGGDIYVVSLGCTMSVVRSIKVKGTAFCALACRSNLLYVIVDKGNKLHVLEYDTGRPLTIVDTDRQGRKLFNCTMYVALNKDGSQIWVADRENGLVVLDKDYNVLRMVKVEKLGIPIAACVDEQNTVFVCCEDPRAVLQLNSDGEGVSTVLQEDDLPGCPLSICYDNNRSQLLVSMDNVNAIKVVHFK